MSLQRSFGSVLAGACLGMGTHWRMRTRRGAGGLRPQWLGGGLEEVAGEYDGFVVASACVFNEATPRSFPWAVDCLEELRRSGAAVALPATEAEAVAHGLEAGVHFDELAVASSGGPALAHAADSLRSHGARRLLAVGESADFVLTTRQDPDLDVALVCTGSLSEAFGLAAAPTIDVPADGGHFVEPDANVWEPALGAIAPPTYALSCLSFSESFFFRYFAERRARARRAHARRTSSASGLQSCEQAGF